MKWTVLSAQRGFCVLFYDRELFVIQYWSLLNWRKMRFRCGFVAVPVNWKCVVISLCFAIFKSVVHSLEPGSKLCGVILNIAKNFKTLRYGCGAVVFIFSIYLKTVLYPYTLHFDCLCKKNKDYFIVIILVFKHTFSRQVKIMPYWSALSQALENSPYPVTF